MQHVTTLFSSKRLIALTLSLASLNASADGYMAAPAQNMDNWAGFYFGVDYTAVSEKTKKVFSGTNLNPTTGALISNYSGYLNSSSGGSIANLFLGYTFQPQASKFLVGGELEGAFFRDLAFNSEVLITPGTPNNTGIVVMPENINSIFSFVGHVGFLVQPSTQIYGVIGGTEAKFTNSFVVNNSTGYPEAFRDKWEMGLTAGAGVEHKISSNWSILAEYRHTHFSYDRIASARILTGIFQSSGGSNVKVDLDMGRVGVAYRC